MVILNAFFTGTTTSFPTLLYPQTASLLCLRLGTILSVSGILTLASRHAVSLDTPPMFFRLASVLTIGRLFLVRVIGQSNFGTHWVNVNMTSRRMDTQNGMDGKLSKTKG